MITINTLDEIPSEHKALFFQMFSSAMCNNKNKEQAKSETKESFIYLFQLFWKRKFNSMSHSHIYFYDWISDNFVPKNAQYDANRKDADLILVGNHYNLAENCFNNLWDAYVKTENNQYKKQNIFLSFWKKLIP